MLCVLAVIHGNHARAYLRLGESGTEGVFALNMGAIDLEQHTSKLIVTK